MRAIRNGLQGAGIPVENSKGEWGPGQEEINVRYAEALDMADRHVILKNGVKEIAWPQGKADHLHGEVAITGWPASSRMSTIRCGSGDGKTPLFFDAKARVRHVAADALIRRRPAQICRATSPGSWRPTSTPTSASRSAPSRRPRRCGAATTAPPASACAARAPRRSASNAASAAPTSIPISPSPALIAAGLAGIDEKLELRAAVLGRRLSAARSCPRSRRRCARRPRRWRSRRCCERRSATTSSSTTSTPREWEQFEYDRRITDWELMRGFERY